MLSKVLVKFAGVVLITDESRMDVTTPADDEQASKEPREMQESSEENRKSQTVTAEEEAAAAEDNSRLKLMRQISAFLNLHVRLLLYSTDFTGDAAALQTNVK